MLEKVSCWIGFREPFRWVGEIEKRIMQWRCVDFTETVRIQRASIKWILTEIHVTRIANVWSTTFADIG